MGAAEDELTVAETAWLHWNFANIERLWELEGRERDKTLFTEGYRRALEDAAAPALEPALEVTADRAKVWAEGIEAERDFQSTGQPRVNPYTGEPYSPVDADLIARAAPDPRETKD